MTAGHTLVNAYLKVTGLCAVCREGLFFHSNCICTRAFARRGSCWRTWALALTDVLVPRAQFATWWCTRSAPRT